MTGLHFNQLHVGDELGPVQHHVTQEVIDLAAVAHLDFNPVHVNEAWAAPCVRVLLRVLAISLTTVIDRWQ